jgi:CO/xanthine dehydrogenase Mo-binding subunit
LPGMLDGRFLTSPYAHAEIKSRDSRRAEAYPGVRAVLRWDDAAIEPEAALGGHGDDALQVNTTIFS